MVAITLRESVSASDNGWSAALWDCAVGTMHRSQRYDVRLVDRIGGGDSFAAGLIYGLVTGRIAGSGAALRRRGQRAEADHPRRLQPRRRSEEVDRLAGGGGDLGGSAVSRSGELTMDLRQLEILRAVAEKGSFTAAAREAERVAVGGQPAGAAARRGARRAVVSPRSAAKSDSPPPARRCSILSRRVLADVRETTASIVEQQQQLAGTLHLGGGMTVCLHVFPALLKEFRHRHPKVDIEAHDRRDADDLLERLRSGAHRRRDC